MEVVDAPLGAVAAVAEAVAEEGAAAAAAVVGAGRDRQTAWTIAPTVSSKRKELVTVDGPRSWLKDLLR